jgi:hypothetical protein
MTVQGLLENITSQELSEWAAYHRRNPIGPERDDWRAAMIACTVANAHRGKRRAYKIQDFLLKFGKKKPQSVEQMRALWGSVVKAVDNGRYKQPVSSVGPERQAVQQGHEEVALEPAAVPRQRRAKR